MILCRKTGARTFRRENMPGASRFIALTIRNVTFVEFISPKFFFASFDKFYFRSIVRVYSNICNIIINNNFALIYNIDKFAILRPGRIGNQRRKLKLCLDQSPQSLARLDACVFLKQGWKKYSAWTFDKFEWWVQYLVLQHNFLIINVEIFKLSKANI
jgi:hypothetical protein